MTRTNRKLASERRRQANRKRAEARKHRRVRARRIVKGTRYKITKRCLERRFFLLPDKPEVTELIGFCLGLCLERFGLELHAACFMSNHYHLDVTDPHGELPAFKCMLNAFIARGLNALRGRFDKFWSADGPCDVELVSDQDVVDGIAYTAANPVEAGLVKRAERWMGLTTAGKEFGSVMKFKRPDRFFDPNNPDVPKEVTVRIVRPAVLQDLTDDELEERIADAVRERELKAGRKLRGAHRRFLGEQRVVRQKWYRWPKKPEDRFTVTPTVSSRSKWARIAALQRNAEWDRAYARAYELRRRGKDVEFPHGTYALRRFAGVRVAAAPP